MLAECDPGKYDWGHILRGIALNWWRSYE